MTILSNKDCVIEMITPHSCQNIFIILANSLLSHSFGLRGKKRLVVEETPPADRNLVIELCPVSSVVSNLQVYVIE